MSAETVKKRKSDDGISPKAASHSTEQSNIVSSVQGMFTNFTEEIVQTVSSIVSVNNGQHLVNLQTMLEVKLNLIIELLQGMRNTHTVVSNGMNVDTDSIHVEASVNSSQRSLQTKCVDKLVELSNLRKFNHYSKIRHCGIKEIYSTGLQQCPSKVPHKLRVKTTNMDTPEIIEWKKRQCLQKVQDEIERLTILESLDDKKINEFEDEATQIIASAPLLTDELGEKWNALKKQEELTSARIWASKTAFLSSDAHLISIEKMFEPLARVPARDRITNDGPRQANSMRSAANFRNSNQYNNNAYRAHSNSHDRKFPKRNYNCESMPPYSASRNNDHYTPLNSNSNNQHLYSSCFPSRQQWNKVG